MHIQENFIQKSALTLTAAAVLALSLGATTALAAGGGNPHFIKKHVTAALGPNYGLLVHFKESGLGNNQYIDYEATADATVVVHCINGGGNFPNAENKQDIMVMLTEPATFNSGDNGMVEQTIAIGAPSDSVPAFCPNGQTEEVCSVDYENIAITDLTNNVGPQYTKPSSFSVVLNPDCPD